MIKENIRQLQKELKTLTPKEAQPVTIVAVTKTVSSALIKEALYAGVHNFAENYVQEAVAKFTELKQCFNSNLTLHLIGSLQGNKVASALQIFDIIEVVDRKTLVDKISRELLKRDNIITREFYIQVNLNGNTTGKTNRGGVNFTDLPDLLTYAREHGLNITGLMGISDLNSNLSIKDQFHKLKQQQIKLKLPNLSMGMSSDYLTAIQCGSTHIRIGQKIFGLRTT